MEIENLQFLNTYIKNTQYPILIEKLPENVIHKASVILKSNCSNEELTGKYVGMEFVEPEWYTKIKEDKNPYSFIIIDNINDVSEKEQKKFIELLKYRKTYIYKLPDNCRILVTYTADKAKPIDEEVYSFLIHI